MNGTDERSQASAGSPSESAGADPTPGDGGSSVDSRPVDQAAGLGSTGDVVTEDGIATEAEAATHDIALRWVGERMDDMIEMLENASSESVDAADRERIRSFLVGETEDAEGDSTGVAARDIEEGLERYRLARDAMSWARTQIAPQPFNKKSRCLFLRILVPWLYRPPAPPPPPPQTKSIQCAECGTTRTVSRGTTNCTNCGAPLPQW